ncbi:MAG: glycosyltransferase family 61 protein [Chitinophagaceae bacterium]|nr:glycosyltransferase family 61 protein [Chitinophagaceae bacterium]
MQLHRKLPVNFVAADYHLFAHELNIEAHEPELITASFVYADLYWYYATIGLSSLKQSQLLYSKMKWRRIFSPKIKYCKKTALVFDIWSTNFFHWMTEVVPKLQHLATIGENLIIYIPEPIFRQSFAKFTLSLFANISFRAISINHITKFIIQKAYFCNLKMQSGNYHPEIIKGAALFLKTSVQQNYLSAKRVFIYRDILDGRGIENFNEIIPLLDQYGFHIVDLGKLTTEEQIASMQNCEILAGVHGAGLTNMMFLPSGAKVLELRRHDDNLNNCYFSLASALGHNYYYLLCNVNDESLPTQQNSFFVDEFAFEKAIITVVN